jgi:integrase/recombinase XerD
MTKQARTLDDARIKKAKSECRNERELLILLLSLYAGLRAVEIAGLKWKDVDDEDARGSALLLKTTKGNKPRNIPMHPELYAAFQAYRASRYVINTDRDTPVLKNTHSLRGQPLTPNSIASWLHQFYKKRLGWDGFSSHSGRRTFATRLARNGLNLKDLKAILGHEWLSTTEKYIDTSPEAQKRVVDMI